MKIVSVVPSQTELLHYLRMESEVVGITKFCVYPNHWWKNKVRIGGTKLLNIEKIKSLKPDWVIANKEENVKEQIEACQSFSKVYTSQISNLTDAIEMIRKVGSIVDKSQCADDLVNRVETEFQRLPLHHSLSRLKVAYLIWKDPIMSVGGDTFIHDMIQRNGWDNVFVNEKRYPIIDPDRLKNEKLDLLLLSSEPYPFSNKHIADFQKLLPQTKIIIVDGTYFSWYGSRLLKAVDYFQNLQKQLSGVE